MLGIAFVQLISSYLPKHQIGKTQPFNLIDVLVNKARITKIIIITAYTSY
jgi:hypothetical protein